MSARRGRKPFSQVERWTTGWYAVARVGMCSGPWTTEAEAQRAVDLWNGATELPPAVNVVMG